MDAGSVGPAREYSYWLSGQEKPVITCRRTSVVVLKKNTRTNARRRRCASPGTRPVGGLRAQCSVLLLEQTENLAGVFVIAGIHGTLDGCHQQRHHVGAVSHRRAAASERFFDLWARLGGGL